MRILFPFDFVDLGPVEFSWIVLALGGLSLLMPMRHRLVTAFIVLLVVAGFGGVRAATLEEASGWDLWGPILFLPPFGAAIVLLGYSRGAFGPRGAGVWLAVLAAVSLLGRPFGLHPLQHLPEWLFLGTLGLGVASLVEESGRLEALARRRLPPGLPAWGVFAFLFLLLCFLARPFGVDLPGGIALLALFALFLAIRLQGVEMRRYVTRRLLGAPVVLLLLLAVAFVLMRTAPGGPFDKDKRLDPEVQKLVEAKYGLDKPLTEQFGKFVGHLVLDGDLGPSFKQKGKTVNEVIATHIGPSAILGLAALCLAVLIGVTAGLVSGIRQNSIFDYSSMTVAMLGLALPTFVVGPMLVLLFAMKLDWFHVTGWDDFPLDLVLPAITLAFPFAARIARLTRAGMLEIVNQDYIRTARAKGLSEPVIVLRHTLKGTLLPVVSFLGPGVAQLLTGSLVVETIFGVPGMGSEFVNSALNRDYPLAMGLVLLFGALLITFNLIVDVAYAFLDPRIRHADG